MRQSLVSWVDTVEQPRVRNGFSQMIEAADPRDDAFDPHAEAGVRDAAEPPEIEVPLERFLRKLVLLDPLKQQVVVFETLPAADDFAVALRGKDVARE